jgi:hypothetical protein
MPTAAQTAALNNCRDVRVQIEAAEQDLLSVLADLADEQKALEAAQRDGRTTDVDRLRHRVDQLLHDRSAFESTRSAAIGFLGDARKKALDTGTGVDLLSAAHPLLLLPVRLETRFAWETASGRTFTPSATAPVQLLVRIFPDTVHEDSHAPELTWTEQEALERLYKRLDAARDRIHLDDAWTEAIGAVGPARAAWLGELIRRRTPAGRRPGVMGRPSVARLLPDRWIVRVTLDDGSVLVSRSSLVAEPLETGPSASGIAWMTDFDAAVQLGMALVVSGLPPGTTALRQVAAYGVRGTMDPADTALALQALVDAHHYTDGFEVLAPGTPTNSTPGERSGWNARPEPESLVPLERRRFAVGMRPDPLCRAGDGTTGSTLAEALGLSTETLAWVRRADAQDGRIARVLRRLLAAAVRRPLATLLRDGVLDEQTLDELIDWAVHRLQAQGPLPALRLGAQPYGVLPLLRQGLEPASGDSIAARHRAVLTTLRAHWLSAAATLPRIGPAGADPAATLVNLLQRDAVAQSVAWRPALGPQAAALAVAGGTPIQASALLRARRAAATQLGSLGAPAAERSGLVNALHLSFAAPLSAPWVQPDGAAAGDPQTMRMALERVASLQPDRLMRQDRADGPWARSLLAALARAAMLESCDRLARERLVAHGANPTEWDDEELPNLFRDALGTPLRRLEAPDPIDPLASIAFHLSEGGRDAPLLADLRADLRWLAGQPAAEVEVLMRACMGLFSHRLDAWFTALATERLEELRAAQATASGLHVGAWGVVEQVRRAPRAAIPGSPDAYADPFNGGHVHAPSAAQAATAAVLRSVHLAHAAAGDGSAFAVDLTSARVRAALETLEGIRNGQTLPALLGYRIERALMQARLQRLTAPLRAVAPLTANQLTPGNQPAERVAASLVVDGLRLLEAAGYDGRQAPQVATLLAAHPGLGPLGADERTALQGVLDKAADLIDALADLSVAEGVHQAVQGNPVRAGAAVGSLAGAALPMPDPGVVRTPRSGVGVTHRIVLLLGDAAAGRDWPVTPRGAAEPRLEALARALLPTPSQIRLSAVFRTPQGQAIATVGPLSLRELHEAAARAQRPELGLGALDLVLMADAAESSDRGPLAVRLSALLDLQRPVAAGDADPELAFERPAGLAPEAFGLAEVLEMARQLRATLARGRPLDGADLLPQGGAAVAAGELAARAVAAERAFTTALGALEVVAPSSPAASWRFALLAADRLGVSGAAPDTVRDPVAVDAQPMRDARRTGLQAQGAAALAELRRRGDLLARLAPGDAAARIRAIFGPGFVVLPQWQPAAALVAPFAPGQAPELGTDGDLRAWLARASAVREPCADLDATLAYAEALEAVDATASSPTLRVAQLGGAAGERWVGRAAAGQSPVPGGRTSVVAVTPGASLPSGSLAGLLIDEWVEVIPAREETTSLAFHFNAPGATAPQVMLLGVPQKRHEAWREDDLVAMIDEALAQARERLVDAEDLQGLGQLLPLLVTAENVEGDTIALGIDTLTDTTR